MQYPPTFLGFLKAIFDTVQGKKLRPRIPKDEPARDIEDYQVYEPDKDPGKEFWQKKAEELAERKEQEKFEAEERMIEDYEFQHKDDVAELKDEQSTSAEQDDFHADIGIEFDEIESGPDSEPDDNDVV